MKTVAVVPMKLNNSRLPNKNIKSFKNGNPLCTYILNTLLSIPDIDEIYVYCSNTDIISFIPNGVKFLKRDEGLDLDTATMNEVLLAFTSEVSADVYVLAHATAPFIKKESIIKGLESVTKDGYDSAFSAQLLNEFLWINDKPFNYSLENIPRTQDLDPIYKETSGFYIFERNVIQNLHRRIGEKPKVISIGEIEAVDIDEYEDFVIAEALYDYNNKYNEGLL